jgi:eukaryotic-like serine/threonine-protein kinase
MLEPGQIIDGKYRIVRLIGEGGMGAVFEGENTRISRRVAIKVLHGAALSNPETVQRFEREAQAAGRIGSDHILEILDLGTLPDGARYMVMEFLNGDTLSAKIRQAGALAPATAVHLIRQALVGLAAAHQAGIVHRDLKPDNLFVLNEKAGIRDFVKLIDFGISKFNSLGGDMSMTRTGAVMGTPYYMSPEQAKGSGQVDHRSDLYAMGVIMYEAVTGSVPFNANTFNELLFKIVLSDPPPLSQVAPHVDPRFAAVVSKAMAREPAQRFGSAAELIQALDSLSGMTHVTLATAPIAGVQAPTDARTVGSFAASQTGVPKRSRAPLFAALAGGAVLLIGGAAVALIASKRAPAAPVAASAAPSASELARKPEPTPEPVAIAKTPEPPATVVESAAPPAVSVAPPVASAKPAAVVKGKPPGVFVKPPTTTTKPDKSRDFGY